MDFYISEVGYNIITYKLTQIVKYFVLVYTWTDLNLYNALETTKYGNVIVT